MSSYYFHFIERNTEAQRDSGTAYEVIGRKWKSKDWNPSCLGLEFKTLVSFCNVTSLESSVRTTLLDSYEWLGKGFSGISSVKGTVRLS